ncbi:hypothetical protein BDQ12DRAFT_653761 [Crucibulum laeve]|uniref:VHS domain-containing protein n=1 Tax=Crucibulum laeve TaxID=68775 RepID=A0A5C3LVT9_9AGAR|nr:hypothetical protein BDQ12DRAFT_653761 [Crucibulum laeve]
MSALSFARQAFGREKPHSSVTDWVDILTASSIQEEAYDGIPELVDAINLQGPGPSEASRALRKKLKHGNTHQQYRALVLLKALVENCGQKFQSTFADGQLTDALKHIASDPSADKRVKKKLMLVLASWRDQFNNDPSMSLVAGLYRQCKGAEGTRPTQEMNTLIGLQPSPEDKRRIEKEEAKRKAKQEKEEARQRTIKEEEDRRKSKTRPKRAPFDFEKDKPKVLASIVDASQASSNLVNAITLVNPEIDSLQTNERVQECLVKAKQARKVVVRYIQLVENEELIGTLIETNERIMSALEMYDKLSTPDAASSGADVSEAITAGLAAAHISMPEGEVARLQEKQRAAVERIRQVRGKDRGEEPDAHVHPDLQDLNFGPIGASSTNLPPPLRPSTLSDDGEEIHEGRGSLSDFSDYETSDEETHYAKGGSSRRKSYVTVSDDEDYSSTPFARGNSKVDDDPFADPFADDAAPSSSKKW